MILFVYKPWRPKEFFKFEMIIINILLSTFRFIWIPMLWVYDLIIFVILSVRGSPLDVRIWRLQTLNSDVLRRFPRWKGWSFIYVWRPTWCNWVLFSTESLIRDGLENEAEDDADDVCIKDKLRQYLDSKVSQTSCTRWDYRWNTFV